MNNNHKKVIKTDNSSDKYLHYLILAGIIILTLIIYWGTFKNGFTNWDDDKQVVNNIDIKDLTTGNIRKIFTNYYVGMYQPLTTLSFALEYKFFGLNPLPYHTDNLLLHLLNVILVFFFIYTLTKKLNISAIVALFFGIHPMHVESVAWISERKDVLYSLFYLGSLIFYLKYIQSKTQESQKSKIKSQNIQQSAFSFNYLFSLLLFILSLLSKPMAVTLPVILILLDYYQKSVKFKVLSVKYWMDKIPFFLLALVFGITAIISEKFTVTNNNMIQYSLFNRFFLLTYSISFYMISLIAPLKLSAIHPPPEIIQVFLPLKYYLSPILIVFIIVVIIRITRINTNYTNRKKDIIFGILFFLITISVVLIVGNVGHAEVAERYTYIPYIGLFFIIGNSINDLRLTIYNLRFIIVVLFILIFSFISYQRNKVWANSLSLWNDVIEKYPRAYIDIAFYNRGVAKHELGDNHGALDDFNRAIEINPQYAVAFFDRGNVKDKLGDMHGAIQDYNRGIELNSQNAEAFYNRGNIKSESGDIHGAIKDFDRAIYINPKFAKAFYDRGNIKSESGDIHGAIKDFDRAIYINPKFAKAFYDRGNAKDDLGDKQGALQDYTKAIENNPQYAEAYNNRGKLSDYKGAIQDYNKAIENNPQYAEAFNNRGITKKKLSDYKGAIQDYNKAIENNPQYAEAFNNRGLAKAALGDKHGALDDFNKAIEINQQYAVAFYNRGLANYDISDKKGACSDWRKAGELGVKEANEMIKEYCH